MKIDKEILNELNDAELENKHDKAMTILKKKQFAEEIRNGLGNIIKNNNEIKIVKTPFYIKLKIFFRELFTKF